MKLAPGAGTALVTGASSGIGEALAAGLARRGLDVVLVARRADRLEALATRLRSAHGRAADPLAADLTDPEGLAAVAARLADSDRPVEVLVNSAGLATEGPFAEQSAASQDEQVQLNVAAVVRLCQAALPAMVERGRGAVVNVSSLAGHQPIPLWATYTATKAFVTTFTRALAAEAEGTGVDVLLLLPGFTLTEFQDQTGFARSRVPGPVWMTPEAVAERALDDLERGRRESIPGFHNRLAAVTTRLSPWPLTRAVLKRAVRRGR